MAHCRFAGDMGSEFDSVASTSDVPGATSCTRSELPTKPYPLHDHVMFKLPP
jgi:hypothetical protein